MHNRKIRELAEKNGVRLWEIAAKLGIMDCNFSRKLRKELPEDEQNEICILIRQIAAEKEAG